MNTARAPELDFLRAALVGGVVVFHAAHVFDPLDFSVKSDAEWDFLVPFILFASLWGMPLFFLLAGMGIWHSLRPSRGRAARWRGSRGRRGGGAWPGSSCS